MTESASFDLNQFIEKSTTLVNDIGDYIKNNNEPCTELLDAMEGLHSELSEMRDKLKEVE